MRIDDIRVHTLVFEYPDALKFRYAGGTCTHRVTSLIEVVAEDGRVGIGSAYSHPGLVATTVEDQLAPLLRGETLDDIGRLWRRMYLATRWFGRKGAVMTAIGGVDTALWDLFGKLHDQPVHRLLRAGSTATSVPAYASALLWHDDPAALQSEAARHRDHGFLRMKMRLGKTPEQDIAALDAVIAGAGREGSVIVDGSMRYPFERALAFSRELAARRVFWFEEPLPPEQVEGLAALRAVSATRIAAGENEFGVQGFAELLRANAVDVVQPDASRCGGISETHAVARLAEAAGKPFAPHSWSDAVAIVANAHVVASLPNGLTVEIDRTGNPLVETLLRQPLTVTAGRLALPEGPGLGIELDPAAVERYRLPPGAPLPSGVYSDMVFGAAPLSPT